MNLPTNSSSFMRKNDGTASPCDNCCAGRYKAATHVLKSVADMRKDGELCDLVLDVGASQFHVHRLVLCVWSPVVRSLLIHQGPAAQSVTTVQGLHHIQVGYSDLGVFEQFVNYLYTGDVPEQAINVPAVLLLAASFKVIQLQQYCEELLKATLNVENMISVHRLAIKFSLKGLEVDCLEFLRKHAADIVQTNEFRELQPEQINAFLGSEQMLQMDPEIKLFLIISWLMEEVANRQQFLVVLLSHIDWSVVADDFLLEISQTDNFFTCNPSSLYLLLQTLHSSAISLGPYEGQFEDLKREYSHLLASVVSNSIALGPSLPQPFQPVSISLISTTQACSAGESSQVSTQHRLPSTKPSRVELKQEGYDNHSFISHKSSTTPLATQDSGTAKIASSAEHVSHQASGVSSADPSPQAFSQDLCEADGPEANNADLDFVDSPAPSRERRKSLRPRKFVSSSEPSSKVKKTEPVAETTRIVKKTSHPKARHQSKVASDIAKDSLKGAKIIGGPLKRRTPVKRSHSKSQISQTKGKDTVPTKAGEKKGSETPKLSAKNESDSTPNPGRSEKQQAFRDKVAPTLLKERKSKTKLANPKKPAKQKSSASELVEMNLMLTCDLCSFTTKTDLKYYRHLSSSHFPGPPHRCDKPDCQFSTPCIKQLAKHRTLHGDKRPFVCTICLQAFRAKNNLHAHIKVHSDERLFKCPECGRSFKQKNTLEQHLVIHSDLRPYLCDLCGFSTKFQSHLISHKKIHSGEVFHCKFPSCLYSTPKRSQLKAHMRSHLGIRTHVCSTCGKAFVEKSHLIRHERIHSTDRAFSCPDCSYTSTRRDKLKEHQQKHHAPKGEKAGIAGKEGSAAATTTSASSKNEASSKKKKTAPLGKKPVFEGETVQKQGTGRQDQGLTAKGDIVEVVVMKRDGKNASDSVQKPSHISSSSLQPPKTGYSNNNSTQQLEFSSFDGGTSHDESNVHYSRYPSNNYITGSSTGVHHSVSNAKDSVSFTASDLYNTNTQPVARTSRGVNDGNAHFQQDVPGKPLQAVLTHPSSSSAINHRGLQPDHQPVYFDPNGVNHVNAERTAAYDSFAGHGQNPHFPEQLAFLFTPAHQPPQRFSDHH